MAVLIEHTKEKKLRAALFYSAYFLYDLVKMLMSFFTLPDTPLLILYGLFFYSYKLN